MRSIIAIGGPHGSGKSSVARRLAEELEMNYVSAGKIFRELATERNYSLKEFSTLAINEPDIDYQIDNRTKELGNYENTVIDAQLAAHFTPKDATIRISITASPEVRWKRISLRDGTSLEEAQQETIVREKAENHRFNQLYNVDVNDFSLYDVVINNDRMSEDQTYQLCESIVKFILADFWAK
ncbi:MAG: (d)CMP kinase [Candidatus Kariarchaeaceae archaeon]|jgi:cytidylate kinase